MKYCSCQMIEGFFLNFNGRLDTGGRCISLCCEPVPGRPSLGFGETAGETLDSFIEERAGIIQESRRFASGDTGRERLFTAGCAGCANYREAEWTSDGLIHYVNLSMYPAPCQSKCIYCGVHRGESGTFSQKEHGEAYERLFDVLDCAKKRGLIDPAARWQVSSGEIAIHPYKDRLLDLVEDQAAVFYTNCFKFDERISQNLKSNPLSCINLSIDAGTPQTWRQIKGHDNFEEVASNLVKYYANSARPGQITLKYILLPGINDTFEDFSSVIEIMKVLKVGHLTISRDTNKKYGLDSEESDSLMTAAAYLLAMCHKNGLTNDMFTFSPAEREQAVALANELLQTGEV